ncbi:purple acid phosphatase 17-like [Humulus lupulus]|uniref:purple acid phosphatase 17-like n=1 Tax=Humulus lupulus TaxID=3486 RepID=UPI002B40B761|nr:purple acid phosphatase 17-like [Humulus lupulus]
MHWFKVCVLINYLIITSFAELERFEHPPKDDGSLSILVVGDWGRNGHFNQSKVAFQMGRIGEKLDVDFVISTGDNFYENGLKSVSDPTFHNSFTNVYTAKSLQKQWYSVLGNHDYRGDVEAQLSPLLRNIDSRWFCLRSFVLNAETAEFFFVDTTPFVESYFVEIDHTYDWRHVFPRRNYLTNFLKDLEKALGESTARWKIVVGHHAIRSVGHHGDTPELIEHLLPLLQANDVDLYINGHDHSLEHISSPDNSIQFITSGAGSKAWRGDVKENSTSSSGNEGCVVRFFYDGQGFMSLRLNRSSNDAEFLFFDVFGNVLHSSKLSKHLHSSI